MENFYQKTSVLATQRGLQWRAGPASLWFLSKDPLWMGAERVAGAVIAPSTPFLLNLTQVLECRLRFTDEEMQVKFP